MTITKNFLTLENFKTIALYTVLFFTLVFGNYFRNDFVAFGWMFSVALIVGYLHRLHEKLGLLGFVLPVILLFTYALNVNFQYVFIAEIVFTLSGYFIGNQALKNKQTNIVSGAIILFLIILSIKYVPGPVL